MASRGRSGSTSHATATAVSNSNSNGAGVAVGGPTVSVGAATHPSPADRALRRVKVAVRIRPPFQTEVAAEKHYQPVVSHFATAGPSPEHKVVLHVEETDTTREFSFDEVFGPQDLQDQVYASIGIPIVENVLEGYNGTLLAYGQTGTGKTYTMGILGCVESNSSGLVPSALRQIFSSISSPHIVESHLELSFIQIYCETIHDLLNPEKDQLFIRESQTFGIYVENVTSVKVHNFQEAVDVINLGLQNRVMAPTMMNETSSRSHTVLTVRLAQVQHVGVSDAGVDSSVGSGTSSELTHVIHSKLTMVDLAGSERVRKTQSNGMRLEEAKSINQSLSSLGNVIAALTDQSVQHIPFRDSKLTRLLQDSIGGNANTCLIATIGPSRKSASESLSTLLFAQRCMHVRTYAIVNSQIDYRELSAKLESRLQAIESDFLLRECLLSSKYENCIAMLTQKMEGHGIHLTAEEEEQINKTPENSALSGDLFRAVRSGEAPIQGIGLPSHSRNLATMSPRQGPPQVDSDTVANLEEAWKLVQYMYKFFQEVFEVSRATIESNIKREAAFRKEWEQLQQAKLQQEEHLSEQRKLLSQRDPAPMQHRLRTDGSSLASDESNDAWAAEASRLPRQGSTSPSSWSAFPSNNSLLSPGGTVRPNEYLIPNFSIEAISHPQLNEFSDADSFFSYLVDLRSHIQEYQSFLGKLLHLKDQHHQKNAVTMAEQAASEARHQVELQHWTGTLNAILESNKKTKAKSAHLSKVIVDLVGRQGSSSGPFAGTYIPSGQLQDLVRAISCLQCRFRFKRFRKLNQWWAAVASRLPVPRSPSKNNKKKNLNRSEEAALRRESISKLIRSVVENCQIYLPSTVTHTLGAPSPSSVNKRSPLPAGDSPSQQSGRTTLMSSTASKSSGGSPVSSSSEGIRGGQPSPASMARSSVVARSQQVAQQILAQRQQATASSSSSRIVGSVASGGTAAPVTGDVRRNQALPPGSSATGIPLGGSSWVSPTAVLNSGGSGTANSSSASSMVSTLRTNGPLVEDRQSTPPTTEALRMTASQPLVRRGTRMGSDWQPAPPGPSLPPPAGMESSDTSYGRPAMTAVASAPLVQPSLPQPAPRPQEQVARNTTSHSQHPATRPTRSTALQDGSSDFVLHETSTASDSSSEGASPISSAAGSPPLKHSQPPIRSALENSPSAGSLFSTFSGNMGDLDSQRLSLNPSTMSQSSAAPAVDPELGLPAFKPSRFTLERKQGAAAAPVAIPSERRSLSSSTTGSQPLAPLEGTASSPSSASVGGGSIFRGQGSSRPAPSPAPAVRPASAQSHQSKPSSFMAETPPAGMEWTGGALTAQTPTPSVQEDAPL